jgi:predicted nucleic acid-binding protein
MQGAVNDIPHRYQCLVAIDPTHTSPVSRSDRRNLPLRSKQHDVAVVPQVVYEFWVVASRPVIDNGLGMTTEEAALKLHEFRKYFLFCNDSESIFAEWEALVTSIRVVGKPAHDARLVAAMKVHGIDHLVTFNVQDFKRFTTIQVHSPSSILSRP